MPNAASPSRTRRPTSRGYLMLAQVAAISSSIAAGVAIALGIWPDAKAAGFPMMVTPFLVAPVVAFGLSALWHMLLSYAAHGRLIHERSLGFTFGLGFCVVGAGCSGWFLATLLGGEPAVQGYRFDFITTMKSASAVVERNVAVDTDVVGAVTAAASNLAGLADAEARVGTVSGRNGQKVVYTSLKNAAASFAAKADALRDLQRQREEALSRYRIAIGDATEATSKGNGRIFDESVARAAAELGKANATIVSVRDIGSGLNLDFARAPIEKAIRDVTSVADDAGRRRSVVEIPAFRPIDPRTAIMVNPQPLAWIAALLIELLPLGFVGLLLTLWRDPDEDEKAPTNPPAAGVPQSVPEPLRPIRPNLTAAE